MHCVFHLHSCCSHSFVLIFLQPTVVLPYTCHRSGMISLLLLTLLTSPRVDASLTSEGDNSITELLSNQMDFIMPENRVIGGNETEPNAWPWTVQLVYKNVFQCGGSLINESFVVTAAHCIGIRLPQHYIVLSGGHRRMSGRPHKVIKLFVHPLYNPFFYLYDIALLKIAPEVKLGESAQVIALPKMPPLDFEMCTIAGWGLTETGRGSRLRQARVPIVPFLECIRPIKYWGRIFPGTMLCAGYPKGGIDSCKGDSGGPLMCERDGQWELQGVVSWGEGCGEPGYPGIYARIFPVIPYLNLMMQLNQ
ncbi:hypothetical protein PMAYCL1PPCAC_06118 [Pristionchus mayeri]|uniref:Peptidase S1 domain-containing protein n=1 Tax=Pristionchus mayeri TaxID=1317129 RepID=A0AAN4ZCD6_9BILA|nr:hypothetical protein PMAYCL1PPCAC_06118 [Pristionchus mayeri]